MAQIPENATLLRLPASRIEASLTADPWISAAEVRRDLPGTVHIAVTERTPAAVVDAGGASVLVVSEDGFWLGPWTSDEQRLVEIKDVEGIEARAGTKLTDPEVSNALQVIDGLSPRLRKAVAHVSAPSIDETAVITRKEVEIFFGEAVQMGEKSRIVEEILDQNKGVVYINVRVTDRPTWRGLGGD
jgi:cell division protein FtsQ